MQNLTQIPKKDSHEIIYLNCYRSKQFTDHDETETFSTASKTFLTTPVEAYSALVCSGVILSTNTLQAEIIFDQTGFHIWSPSCQNTYR